MQSIETMLLTVPGFTQLEGPDLECIAAIGDFVEVRQGDVLLREGTMPEWLYVLLKGRISLTGTAADSSSAVIDILGPTCSFVLADALTGQPHLMGAEAVGASLLIRIAAAPLRTHVAARPTAAMAMMHAMSAELGGMTRQVIDLKLRVAAERLGTYLLSLVNETTANRANLRLPVNKGLLAPWLGCRAENLSRAFAALRTYGVETHGSRVVLHDISRLRAYIGDRGHSRRPVEKTRGDAFELQSERATGT
jgi:CRP-like cAMP-binding protein